MKLSKKILALALCLLMIVPMFIACADDTTTPKDTTPASESNSESTSESESKTPDPYVDDLVNPNLNGKTIGVFVRTNDGNKNEFAVESYSGSVLDNAVYERQIAVETRINCKIDYDGQETDSARDILREQVMSGSSAYDVFVNSSMQAMVDGVEGYYENLKEIDNLDLEKSYWSSGVNNACSIGSMQFLATGEMSMSYYRSLLIYCFNKDMFDACNINTAEVYQLVRDGKWTLEAVKTLAAKMYANLDDDPEVSDGDQFGFVTKNRGSTGQNDSYFASCDLHAVTKDADNYYEYNVNTETWVNNVNKLIELMNAEGTRTAIGGSALSSIWSAGRGGIINCYMRDIEDDGFVSMGAYGILPAAKADESLDYMSVTQDQFLVYSIPFNRPAKELANIGTFLEAFASESYATVIPAYTEAVLRRYSDTSDDFEMIKLIASHVVMDPVIPNIELWKGGLTVAFMRDSLEGKTDISQSTVASDLAGYTDSMKTMIKNTNDAIKALEAKRAAK